MGLAIECTDVRKTFPNVVAVDGLSFQVGSGEVFGLVGPDGAGKTTTIRMLCGIMAPDHGAIRVLGKSIPAQVGEVVSDIGYMSQRFSLYGDLTVDENLEFFASIHQVPPEDWRPRSEELLHASRMEPYRKRLAGNLSGGMKQKLALACTLIHTPKVLFLDEPTTGVDPISRREFWQILYDLVAKGMTLVVSTPYMDEADRCQKLGLMSKGKLLMCDTPANLRKSMDRAVIDLEVGESKRARQVLARCEPVLSVEAFGERLHATVLHRNDLSAVKADLERAGIDIRDIRIATASLEDAFITFLEEAGQHA